MFSFSSFWRRQLNIFSPADWTDRDLVSDFPVVGQHLAFRGEGRKEEKAMLRS